MEEYFSGKCAYCDGPLTTRWHADHLLSVDSGGFNHISNRVPACPRCNEHEKRDMAWPEFLERKSGGNKDLFEARKARIESWIRRWVPTIPPVNAEQRQAWKAEVDSVAVAIDTAWKRLKGRPGP
jgi:hypothetical protein